MFGLYTGILGRTVLVVRTAAKLSISNQPLLSAPNLAAR
jgi:hypothetical protein